MIDKGPLTEAEAQAQQKDNELAGGCMSGCLETIVHGLAFAFCFIALILLVR